MCLSLAACLVFSVGSLALVGCRDKKAMPENRPNSVSPSGSGIGESKSMLVELADLKAQLEGFTTFAACVAKMRATLLRLFTRAKPRRAPNSSLEARATHASRVLLRQRGIPISVHSISCSPKVAHRNVLRLRCGIRGFAKGRFFRSACDVARP